MTSTVPALPTFLPRSYGVPVAPFSMQRILTKAIRGHGTKTNLKNTQVKGADKMGGKRGASRSGRTSFRSTGRAATPTGKK